MAPPESAEPLEVKKRRSSRPGIDSGAGGDVELVRTAEHLQRVVIDGIANAKVSLAIATADFKAMLVPMKKLARGRRDRAQNIVEIFRGLAERGVEVRLLHSGVPSNPVLHELRRDLPGGITIRRCPRVHMKLVIVDCRAMYLGSANLTGAGLGAKGPDKRNFEMGVWTQSPALIDAALEEFNSVWEGQRCPACKRRNLCPVPLEEPRLARK